MKGYIYKITSPSGKVYVGQTIDIKTRKNKYRYLNCKNQTRLYKSLLKYGWENHAFEILETVDVDDLNVLNSLEIEWILKLDCFKNGLNCTLGGHGNSGREYSEESKLKMRNSQIGKKQSKEQIDKRVKSLVGKKRSEEFKKHISNIKKGRSPTEETKQKLSNINKGKKHSDETKLKISNSGKGRVVSEETRKKISDAKRIRDLIKKDNL
jgi:group I intron endonuclease